eukprot:scaffold32059_cov46-Phaeocystis_antarctica.AAC.2
MPRHQYLSKTSQGRFATTWPRMATRLNTWLRRLNRRDGAARRLREATQIKYYLRQYETRSIKSSRL